MEGICGTSNPMKGLLNQQDQDRSLQQDRFTEGPSHKHNNIFRDYRISEQPTQEFASFLDDNTVIETPIHERLTIRSSQNQIQDTSAVSNIQHEAPPPETLNKCTHISENSTMTTKNNVTFLTPNPYSTPTFYQPRPMHTHIGFANSPVTTIGASINREREEQYEKYDALNDYMDEIAAELKLTEENRIEANENLADAKDSTIEDPGPSSEESSISSVARKIVETVEHEEGDKWKKSTFLALMKDLRDGRQDIIDNDIIFRDQ